MNSIGITIAIPTYGREVKLLQRVSELLPQMSENDVLLIIDNASPGFRPELHAALSDPRVRLSINKSNIGGNANIVRCFDRCETNWMWLLSDDDRVMPTALEKIKSEIAEYPDACYINFTSSEIGKQRQTTKPTRGLEEFLRYNDGFSNTLLISNNVYQLSEIRQHLKFAYAAIWTNAPHIAPVIKALEGGARAIYSSEKVVVWERPDLNESWAIAAGFNLVNLTTVLQSSEHLADLRRVIIRGLPPPEFLILQLCYMSSKFGNKKQIGEYARQVLQCYAGCSGLLMKTRALLLRLALAAPALVVWLARVGYRAMRGKDLEKILQSRNFSFYL